MPRIFGDRIMLREYLKEDLQYMREWVNNPDGFTPPFRLVGTTIPEKGNHHSGQRATCSRLRPLDYNTDLGALPQTPSSPEASGLI